MNFKFFKFDNLKMELRKGNFKLIFASGISLILVGIFFYSINISLTFHLRIVKGSIHTILEFY